MKEEEEICDGCYEPIDYCTCDDDELCEDSENEFGCEFPGECCMPEDHLRSECYTPEMAEDWSEEY